MSTNVVNVARSVAEHETANAVDRATVIIDRIEIYYHNDTLGADRENPDYDEWRGLFPYDTDEVSLVAVVWAKGEDDENFKPYSGEGFENDGLYYCPCEKRPSPASNRVPWDWREKEREDRLPLEIKKVEAWPWTGIDMQFEWQQLVFKGDGGNDGRDYWYEKPKLVRMTTFPEGMENSPDAIASEELIHDWDIPLTPGAYGTHRYRVVLGLEGQVKFGKRFSRMEADHLNTLKLCDEFETKITSKRESGRHGYAERGMSLRLSVRRANLPNDIREGMTDTLRWATAFVNTAYDNGGHWFGGRVAEKAVQTGAKQYGGHGIDCNGFICGAAMLGGLPGYAPVPWEEYKAEHGKKGQSEEDLKKAWNNARRRYRYAPMKRDLRWYKGAQVQPDDLKPGDMLDYMDHSHVALVYDVDHSSGQIWILDSSGSRQGVSIHELSWKTRNVANNCQLVDLTDRQPRPWKE